MNRFEVQAFVEHSEVYYDPSIWGEALADFQSDKDGAVIWRPDFGVQLFPGTFSRLLMQLGEIGAFTLVSTAGGEPAQDCYKRCLARRRRGTSTGRRHSLTDGQIIELRKKASSGKYPISELCATYGISPSTYYRVLSR
jgi:hypothetical protein